MCDRVCLTLLIHNYSINNSRLLYNPLQRLFCNPVGSMERQMKLQLYRKSLHCKGILCEGSRLMIHEITTCLSRVCADYNNWEGLHTTPLFDSE